MTTATTLTPECEALLTHYLNLWQLVPAGLIEITNSSVLLPVVRDDDTPAMLKLALHPEECAGASLMLWWNGEGSAKVLGLEGSALLLERALGTRSLAEMAREGRDDEASQILCAVVAKLHEARPQAPPPLVPLNRWFAELEPAAARFGGVFVRSLHVSRLLLSEPRENVVLHGDLHHGNVLDGGEERGWLAIDPKGLFGERGFDFANVFLNPDSEVATAPGRLAHQVQLVAQAAHLERRRLLQWVLAYSGLSAAWSLGPDAGDAALALSIAERAANELDLC